MIELIKIEEVGGQKVVSARELYTFLGLPQNNYTRWVKKHITENPYAREFEDWTSLATMASEAKRGNFAQDYALTLDFAKRLSMMARSEKGEQVRRYFVQAEEAAKEIYLSQVELMSMLQYKEEAINNLLREVYDLEQQLDAIKGRIEEAPIGQSSIMEFWRSKGQRIDPETNMQAFNLARKVCKDIGYMNSVYSYGLGTGVRYPVQVLDLVFWALTR